MLRFALLIGSAVGALLGYLASDDIDTSLGTAKVPFYIAMGTGFGALGGLVACCKPVRGADAADRLSDALQRAERAEAEVRRLQAKFGESNSRT